VKKRTRISLVVVAVLFGFFLWDSLQVKYGVGVDSVGWLPREARDITYLKVDFTSRTAEFTIEREAFEKWCARRGMPLRKLDSGGYHVVNRCLWGLEQRGIIPSAPEPNEPEGGFPGMDHTLKHFDPGDLFYEERWSNGGGYSIGYDVEEKRGYYDYNHH